MVKRHQTEVYADDTGLAHWTPKAAIFADLRRVLDPAFTKMNLTKRDRRVFVEFLYSYTSTLAEAVELAKEYHEEFNANVDAPLG